MKTEAFYLMGGTALSLALILSGCGSSGTTDTTTTTPDTKTMYTVSGTVPGTLIEAFCKDGSYYSVNSIQNGTGQHPFTLTLPADTECKFIMTTNENDPDITKRIVTPVLLQDANITASYFQLKSDTDIGYIPLPTTGAGIQTPVVITVADERVVVTQVAYDPLDKDADNIPNLYEDDDNDGIYNIYDDDDDNDGIKDYEDDDYKYDKDGDGIEDRYDSDDDNDHIRDEEDDDSEYYTTPSSDYTGSTPVTLPTSYTPDAGRLLGSQCAQCHGTNGISVNDWDSIAGEDDLHDEMFEDDEPIMMTQAKGYTPNEITLIENWLKTLKKYDD